MTRGMKKEMAMEEEEGEVFTISREGIGEGGHVQVLALLVPKYFLLLSSPLFGHVHCASTHMFFFFGPNKFCSSIDLCRSPMSP